MGVPGFAGGTQGWGTTGGMEGNFLGAPRGDIWGWGSWGILGKNRGGAPGEPRGSTGVPGHLEDGGPGAFLGGSGERRYGDGGTGMAVRGWRYGDGGTCFQHRPTNRLIGDQRGRWAPGIDSEGVGAAGPDPAIHGEDDEEEGEKEEEGEHPVRLHGAAPPL